MKNIDRNKFLFKELPFWLIFSLVVLIPFQAFFITYLRSILNLSDFGVFLISAWKEYVLICLISLALAKFLKEKKLSFSLILADKIILGFFVLGILYFIFFGGDLAQKIAGLRYDTELFLFYFMARLFVFDKKKLSLITRSFIISGLAILTFGLLQIFLLPPSFLEFFGYSSGLAGYNQTGVLPTYELLNPALPGIYRVQSFLPGALQFSSYLLLLFFLVFGLFVYSKKMKKYLSIMLVFLFIALVFTFTRSAWIGLSVAMLVSLFIIIRNKYYVVVSSFVVALVGYFSFRELSNNLKFQAIFLHGMVRDNELFGSTLGHLNSMKESFVLLLSNPLGLGLGVSGPASRYAEDALIPESWYLQIGSELGILGLIIFLAILIVVAKYLFDIFKKSKDLLYKSLGLGLLGALMAISVSSLFLHTWADTATVYPFWILFGLLVSQVDNSDIMKKERR